MNRPEPRGWLAAFLRRQGKMPPRATGILLVTLAGTLTVVLVSGKLYKTFFTYQDMSYGATLAWFLFAIILAVTIMLFATAKYGVYYAGEARS